MLRESIEYCASREITRRQPIYSANRFAKLVADVPLTDLTTELLEQYRFRCSDQKLSARTIESSISDLLTLYRAATGKILDPGRRLKLKRPEPDPIPLADIDKLWPHCDRWLQQWIVLTQWTCLRLTDCLQLQLSLPIAGGDLRWTASKTGHRHAWPVPEWLREWLKPVPLPYKSPNDFAAKILRSCLASHCKRSQTTVWTPKNFRQRGITEWMRADGTAGRLVHGQGLGVLSHYVDPCTLLEPHQHKVRLPQCFGASTVDDISIPFQRLDPDAQRIVRETITRFA